MKFIHNCSWQEVFASWQQAEESSSAWQRFAADKGWKDWSSWRGASADLLCLPEKSWHQYSIENPLQEIPQFLLGPFFGWQKRTPRENTYSFQDLAAIPSEKKHFSLHKGVVSIIEGLPFPISFIGLLDEKTGSIICVEGHHRAMAITLVALSGQRLDFSQTPILLYLATLPKHEHYLLEEHLYRSKQLNAEK